MATTQTRITRSEIERDARAYLTRTRNLHHGNGFLLKHDIQEEDFEAIVKREVAITVNQLRKVGKTIED